MAEAINLVTVISGLVVAAVLVVFPIVLFCWWIKLKKIAKNIPSKYQGGKNHETDQTPEGRGPEDRGDGTDGTGDGELEGGERDTPDQEAPIRRSRVPLSSTEALKFH